MSSHYKEDEDDLKILFDISIDMLCIADMSGYFKRINPSFSRLLGYSDEELLAKPYIELIHIDDIEATKSEMVNSRQGNSISQFENRYRHKNGSYRILSWSARSDLDKGLIYAIARDVTDERIANNKLQQIQNALNDHSIVVMTDKSGLITEANDRFCEISGYSKTELIGQSHRIINSGAHNDDFFRDLWKTISSGKSWTGLIENRKKSGEHYFVYSVITPIFDIQGKICNYLAIRFETTKHIKVKKQLIKTLNFLNESGAIAKVGGWELNVDTNQLNWTDETFNIFEIEKKLGQNPVLPEGLELFVPAHKPTIEKAIERAIEFGDPYSLELQAQTAKGNVLWIYINGKANYKDGKVVSLSGTIQDINARKLTEKKYEIERQKSIRNRKLAALGELAAGIAHEINNPLAIIYGSTQLLPRYTGNPEKLNSKIKVIKSSCDRISHITKSLKKYSRSDDEQDFSVHRFKDVINEAITLTNSKSKRYLTTISFDCQTDASILCNDIEIEQVIINLINNAIDAIKKLPEKWIELKAVEEDSHVIMTISDSGSGIPAEICEKLFDPFFTTKATGEGTGLGLSITKGILDEHNANISVNQKSPNTCFTIQFKKHQEEVNAT